MDLLACNEHLKCQDVEDKKLTISKQNLYANDMSEIIFKQKYNNMSGLKPVLAKLLELKKRYLLLDFGCRI